MAERPAEYPDFATNPDPADITAPTTTQQNDGYAINEHPGRQVENWLRNRTGGWVRFLDEHKFNPQLLFNSQPVPGATGDRPSTGAGFSVGAADFTGTAIIEDAIVFEVDGPAHTYAANSDTYWDLSKTGAWNAVVVATGDPEPAVSADSERFYMVTTDGAGRTSVTDYRPDNLFVQQELLHSQVLGLSASGVEQADPQTEDRILLASSVSPSGFPDAATRQRYVYFCTSFNGSDSPGIEFAINCYYDFGASAWRSDFIGGGTPRYLYRFTWDGLQVLESTISPGPTWTDADWSVLFKTSLVDGIATDANANVIAAGGVTDGVGDFTFSTAKRRNKCVAPIGWKPSSVPTNGGSPVHHEYDTDDFHFRLGTFDTPAAMQALIDLDMPEDSTAQQFRIRYRTSGSGNLTFELMRRDHVSGTTAVLETDIYPASGVWVDAVIGANPTGDGENAYVLRVSFPSTITQIELGNVLVRYDMPRAGG